MVIKMLDVFALLVCYQNNLKVVSGNREGSWQLLHYQHALSNHCCGIERALKFAAESMQLLVSLV